MSEDKLDKIISMLREIAKSQAAPAPVPQAAPEPWQVRELTAAEIDPATADGVQVQRDGSAWGTSKGENGPAGALVQEMYGYISKEKDPAMWGRMVVSFGGDEVFLRQCLDVNGKLARYKMHPNVALYMHHTEAFMLLSQSFGNPTPPTAPTV